MLDYLFISISVVLVTVIARVMWQNRRYSDFQGYNDTY
jgi:hypothetical protein